MQIQNAAEAPGDGEPVGAFCGDALRFQQGQHARADGALGQLQHPDVLLGQGYLRRQGIFGLLAGKGTGLVDDLLSAEHRRRIDDAAAADTRSGGICDGMAAELAAIPGHSVDGSGAGLHAPGDGGALKDRARCGGAAQQAALMPQSQLTIGADIRQQGALRPGTDLAGHQGRGDVSPYKGRHASGEV